MNINNFRYVITLAEEGNFTKASERLYISQPTLSIQINQIEKELGVKLFNRDSRKITLTSEGLAFIEYAKKILNTYDHMLDELPEIQKIANGKITIGLYWAFGCSSIKYIIQDLQNKYPDLKMNIVVDGSSTLIQKVLDGELDCAFITGAYMQNDLDLDYLMRHLELTLLSESPLMCITNINSKLAKKKIIYPDDLNGESILHLSKQSNLYSTFDSYIHNNRNNTKILGYSSQPEVVLQIARLGLGSSFLTKEAFDNSDQTDITAVPLSRNINRQLYFIHHSKPTNKNIFLIKELINN